MSIFVVSIKYNFPQMLFFSPLVCYILQERQFYLVCSCALNGLKTIFNTLLPTFSIKNQVSPHTITLLIILSWIYTYPCFPSSYCWLFSLTPLTLPFVSWDFILYFMKHSIPLRQSYEHIKSYDLALHIILNILNKS